MTNRACVLTLPNGYNGDRVQLGSTVLAELPANSVQLGVVGRPGFIRWTTRDAVCLACGATVDAHLSK